MRLLAFNIIFLIIGNDISFFGRGPLSWRQISGMLTFCLLLSVTVLWKKNRNEIETNKEFVKRKVVYNIQSSTTNKVAQISRVCKIGFFQLQTIGKIRKFLIASAVK